MRQCDTCGAMFEPTNGKQKRCSGNPDCRRKYWREKARRYCPPKSEPRVWGFIACQKCGNQFDTGCEPLVKRPVRCSDCRAGKRAELFKWRAVRCGICSRNFISTDVRHLYCSETCGGLAKKIAWRKVKRQRVLNGLCARHGNPGQCAACQARNFSKSSKRRGSGGAKHVTKSKIKIRQLCEQQKWKCSLCGGRISLKYKNPDPLSISVDHVIPVSLGGTHDLANLRIAHRGCNIKKGNRSLGPEQLRMMA
jgi:5-methylcytosine-specific restriction endonuclease McrA